MSFLEKISVKKYLQNKREKTENARSAQTGIVVKDLQIIDSNKKIYFFITNGLLNFFILAGSIFSFLEGFGIESYKEIVIITLFLISMYSSFLYYNNWVKIIGYLLGISGFLFGIVNLGYVINGGFGTIVNRLMEVLENELDLPIERRYEIFGQNEKMAVSIAIVFIGFVIALLFNMIISENKGFALIFLGTFPIVQLPMYFEISINIKYFTLYMVGIICLFVFRSGKHFRIENKKRHGYSRTRLKNKKIIFDYNIHGKTSLFTVITILAAISVCMLIFNMVFDEKKFNMDQEYKELRYSTNDFAKQFALVGLSGMLNGDGKSAGGVGRNRLGQINKITFDYNTDLIVYTKQVEYEKAIYLKGFYGTYYNNGLWNTISEETGNKNAMDKYDLNKSIVYKLNYKLQSDIFSNGITKIIEVRNVMANPSFYYIVNNSKKYGDKYISSAINDDENSAGLKYGWMFKNQYLSYPMDKTVAQIKAIVKKHRASTENSSDNIEEDKRLLYEQEDKYYEYVKDNYLFVPKKNVKAIEEFSKNYGLNLGDEDIVEKVIKIFVKDYEYTLMPGKTPKTEDFINYFLLEQKKGFCSYYASAATLIFRYFGIPARYTGGYKISGDTILDGEKADGFEDIKEDNIYKYTVNDTCAHAWVEIYIEDLGWIPIEVTPSSDFVFPEEEEEQASNLGKFLTNTLFSQKSITIVKNTTSYIFKFIIICIIIIVVGYIAAGIFIRRKRHMENQLLKKYQYFNKCLNFFGISKSINCSYKEYGQLLIDSGLVNIEEYEVIFSVIEKEKFSSYSITLEENKAALDNMENIIRRGYKKQKFYKKFIYKIIKML